MGKRKGISIAGCLLAACSLIAVSVSADAAPSVDGLTISWPNDGYYQVQRARDFVTVCEGTRLCIVASGEYTVINHTTQQRFENIVVTDSTTSGGANYQLAGNTFTFPEGNWYQVQDASTFASVCNGEANCEVEAGRYVVINHTLQERYDNVLVGSPTEPSTPDPAAPTVTGNVISWADDGWYQVQNSVNFVTLCEGGRECVVPTGSYNVINLTTSVRFENIVVGDQPVEPSLPTPLPEPGPAPSPVQGGFYPAGISIADTNVVLESPASGALPEGAQLVGDVNGDGLGDLLLILEGDQTYQRSAAILFADAQGSYPDLPLNENLNTDVNVVLSHGFLISDVGRALTGVGDVNNDGYDDLSLRSSGFFEFPNRFVVAGAASFPARINTADFSDAQILVQLPISADLEKAGDFNGDGIADLFVASPTDVRGGVIYGANDLNTVVGTRQELRDTTMFPGCSSNFCSIEPIGDFDGDGIDDLFARRFGANDCGFSGFAVVLYGQAGGIERASNIYEYAPEDVTRIVDEQGGDCFSGSIAGGLAGNDVDGDGAADLFLTSRLSGNVGHVVFGTSDRRREFLSISELDGQLGFKILESDDIDVRDTNGDGFDDIVFDNGNSYLGYARNSGSVDGPVVRRTPTSFIINVADTLTVGADRLAISMNGVSAGEFPVGTVDITVDNFVGTGEALITMDVLSADDATLRTLRRVAPEFFEQERVTAALLAPRLVELTFNADTLISRYSHYLVWRDGVPIGRSVNGADNYVDHDVELGRTYTYHVTPDYLYDDSFDASMIRGGPLVQRQSNSVSITTPEG